MSLRITTDEHLYLTLSPDELVKILFSDMHFDYSDVAHRGRPLDLPEAWCLMNVWLGENEVTVVFSLSETTRLTDLRVFDWKTWPEDEHD